MSPEVMKQARSVDALLPQLVELIRQGTPPTQDIPLAYMDVEPVAVLPLIVQGIFVMQAFGARNIQQRAAFWGFATQRGLESLSRLRAANPQWMSWQHWPRRSNPPRVLVRSDSPQRTYMELLGPESIPAFQAKCRTELGHELARYAQVAIADTTWGMQDTLWPAVARMR